MLLNFFFKFLQRVSLLRLLQPNVSNPRQINWKLIRFPDLVVRELHRNANQYVADLGLGFNNSVDLILKSNFRMWLPVVIEVGGYVSDIALFIAVVKYLHLI